METTTTPVLSTAEMRKLGFTDRTKDNWYFCAGVDSDTTLNISINKETGVYTEYVLNEFGGQPEYYGRMKEPFRSRIHDAIEKHLAKLNAAGLDVHVDHSLYGYSA
jgi:hypothetical protein